MHPTKYLNIKHLKFYKNILLFYSVAQKMRTITLLFKILIKQAYKFRDVNKLD